MTPCMAYITAPNLDEAKTLAEAAVRARYAACANIYPMQSVYWWDEKIETASEYVLILKTLEEHFEQLTQVITTSHSYECPCVLKIPISGGHKPYLAWLEKEATPRP